MATFKDIGSGIAGIGGAIGSFGAASQYGGAAAADLLSAQGYDEEAGFYDEAGKLVNTSRGVLGLEQRIADTSNKIRGITAFRTNFKTVGAQKAAVAASGLELSGSALDVVSSSEQQGELERQIIREEGGLADLDFVKRDIEFEQQGASYSALAAKARAAAAGARESAAANRAAAGASKAGGVLGIVGGILGLFGCWVAREVYGADNPRWLDWREWMMTRSPLWFYKLYFGYGIYFARFIRNKPRLKWLVRWAMEKVLKHAAHL